MTLVDIVSHFMNDLLGLGCDHMTWLCVTWSDCVSHDLGVYHMTLQVLLSSSDPLPQWQGLGWQAEADGREEGGGQRSNPPSVCLHWDRELWARDAAAVAGGQGWGGETWSQLLTLSPTLSLSLSLSLCLEMEVGRVKQLQLFSHLQQYHKTPSSSILSVRWADREDLLRQIL